MSRDTTTIQVSRETMRLLSSVRDAMQAGVAEKADTAEVMFPGISVRRTVSMDSVCALLARQWIETGSAGDA